MSFKIIFTIELYVKLNYIYIEFILNVYQNNNNNYILK